ncbi:J domain-containing protein [Paenibacillus ginsengarvi]|uniref:J domain-containing protein n=1 Tax=Paenibacillus ginsengarvi TaxID=400777 RepID=A0A3B0CK39_9BACL|nr:J domain-containing protein [Paenibacillus ginsengarvi]RKN85773.1 J domain-containing protein [Paenibacillus ginsengarvi]
MADNPIRLDEIKRKVRKLKKLEVRIRFNGINQPEKNLIWDNFFKLSDTSNSKAKYSLQLLASMSHEEYMNVVNEYVSLIYFELYKESGMISESGIYDPVILSRLDLPFHADETSIKKRFRELAKKYHPDAGGDAAMFMELMDHYRKLLRNRE